MKNTVLFLLAISCLALHAQEVPTATTSTSTTTSINFIWYAVDSADGYKVAYYDSYDSVIATIADTSYEITALVPNTSYTMYFWAYNECGHGSPLAMTDTTLDDYVCGSSITRNHVAGSVAPVSKTVTYGTVKNIPGEEELCWITRNLGATQQAVTVADTTEASAGWYFQFNRKQGYKYDGITRTPSSVWITSIIEYLDWTTDNNPCALELGSNWRLPTLTEWTNVDHAGGWSTWVNPYASTLKMHAAGYLTYTNGVVGSRGIGGFYWSGTQSTTETAWALYFMSSASTNSFYRKTFAYPVRCVRESVDDFTCGETITRYHIAGDVAPVNKSVTYGTVTDVPGETDLCWITRNLGAATRATSKTDATENSAGWYWQFNLKQGYKYTTTRTPSSAWITSINESSNWLTVNDPCSIELGSSWRIPTSTEWTNVDAAGAWTSYTQTYNSLLKLHAAGRIHSVNGTLGLRGSEGAYFSSNQSLSNSAWGLYFSATNCALAPMTKAYGFSIRCVRETDVDTCTVAPTTPTEGTHTPATTIIIWAWNEASGATGYKFGTTTTYASATDLGLVLTKTESSLTQNTPYTRYLWAYNDCGHSDSLILRDTTTLPVPSAPTTSTHTPSLTQMVWNWNTSTYATGYKWNTVNTYATAIDMGTDTTKIETGLTKNTKYTRYVWAYNIYGNSTALTISDTTLDDWVFGDSITVAHISGTIAPVTKTVTYQIIKGIPGDTSKFWITSNLGSTNVPTSKSDATEASAGWYWQFNKKQGYKHDIYYRTPTSAWITSISETSDWLLANDPCSIELKGDWRIPTKTEWTIIDAVGSWINADSVFVSDLGLHMAGYLSYTIGKVSSRGSSGGYWSSTQANSGSGYAMTFTSTTSAVYIRTKTTGYPIRCIK